MVSPYSVIAEPQSGPETVNLPGFKSMILQAISKPVLKDLRTSGQTQRTSRRWVANIRLRNLVIYCPANDFRTNRWRLTLSTPGFLVVALIVGSLTQLNTQGAEPRRPIHEFPDGFIERSVSVTFEDMTATIEYSVGCNPSTMLSLMKLWSQVPTAEAATNLQSPASEKSDSSNTDSPGTDSPKTDAPKTKSAQPKPSPQLQASPAANATPAAAPQAVTAVDTEMTPQEIEAIEARFREALLHHVSKNLKVRIDKQLKEPDPVRVAVSPRHHINATLVMEVEFEHGGEADFSIEDALFLEFESAFRYAAKAKGDALLLRSNVAPILVRADRIESQTLTAKAHAAQARIDVRVSFGDESDE